MVGLFKIRLGKAQGLSRVGGLRAADLFNNLDANQSRAIDKEELTKYLKVRKVDLSSDQIGEIMKKFGDMGKLNEDGEIPYPEFVTTLQARLS